MEQLIEIRFARKETIDRWTMLRFCKDNKYVCKFGFHEKDEYVSIPQLPKK
jgi:hypothetical protein